MRDLLDAGCDTRATDKEGRTPLHLALWCWNEAAAELLADVDGENNIQDALGFTPLHYAAVRGLVGIIQKLLACGADTRLKDVRGMTPLHTALALRHECAARSLLEADSALDSPDEEGRTPLHYAALRGSVQIARELLSRGVCPHVKADDGKYPLHIALRESHYDVRGVILAAYACRGIAIDWNEMKLPPDQMERCILLLSVREAEIRRMKDSRVEGSRLSFYHVARRPTCRIAPCLSNEVIRRLLVGDGPVPDFPVYGHLLASKLKQVEERRNLADRCLECFCLLSRKLSPLPLTCIDIIFLCLTSADMRNFIRAIQHESRSVL
ncbi:poly [ADP-ribose] polymerase tankyrase-2-like [Uloborus diversus]|uniref:poly [ADP-ribose] polymerase tankyrase-2-like n=1 Tax=Uloborus diversus TaxID=327109 RepID=UPI0024098035|nr:poly [ADP-ribose] polymerase tankyrase-2-like [Uloborus diversus]